MLPENAVRYSIEITRLRLLIYIRKMITRLAKIYSVIVGYYSVQIQTCTLTFLAFRQTFNFSVLLLLLVAPSTFGKLELKYTHTSEHGHSNSRALERGTLHPIFGR